MRLLFPFMTLTLAFPLREGAAQSPWYARDRWQLELATGSVIFERAPLLRRHRPHS
jgi:hypothetical protein